MKHTSYRVCPFHIIMHWTYLYFHKWIDWQEGRVHCEVWSKVGSGLNFEWQCEPYSAHKFQRWAEKHVMQRSLFCAVCPEQREVGGGREEHMNWILDEEQQATAQRCSWPETGWLEPHLQYLMFFLFFIGFHVHRAPAIFTLLYVLTLLWMLWSTFM